MKIQVLVENHSCDERLGAEHGLCLLVEALGKRFLFDLGASGLLATNAQAWGANLRGVDFALISHGHHDHGGGLAAFLEVNDHAPIYIRKRAFDRHYTKRAAAGLVSISLEQAFFDHRRIVYTDDAAELGEGLLVFGTPTAAFPLPAANRSLFVKKGGAFVPDDFSHEQSLLIREGERLVLLAGCAHRGIVNIVETAKKIGGRYPDYVWGGFHLAARMSEDTPKEAYLSQLAQALLASGAMYYTGHCTGETALSCLRTMMKDRIAGFSAGCVWQP